MAQRYEHRAFMLDVARHYMPVEDIRLLLRAAAACGLNRMHWHLTDDQGWRIEIKRYPRLTEVGSVRGESHFGAISATENNCGYYTQEEIRAVVAYAQGLGIAIIPEIEIPGHASAMLAAYPQYGCRRTLADANGTHVVEEPYTYEVLRAGGVFPNLICAGKDESLRFIEDILDEVIDLFPFPMIHLGGDEAVKAHWRRCPDCQARMRREGIPDEHALQIWLTRQIGDYLAAKGRKSIVWNDSLSGGPLPPHFIVQQWHGNQEETAAFMAAGGQVIRSDTDSFYFDYAYSTIDVHRIWAAPDVPAYAEGHEAQLLGVECPLWTERVTNLARASHLLFPRLPAMALKYSDAGRGLKWESFAGKLKERIAALGDVLPEGAPASYWHLTPEDAEQERAEETRLRTSPGAQKADEECRLILRQERLEKLLHGLDLPEADRLVLMDEAWNTLPGWNGGTYTAPDSGAAEAVRALLEMLETLENGQTAAWSALPEDTPLQRRLKQALTR